MAGIGSATVFGVVLFVTMGSSDGGASGPERAATSRDILFLDNEPGDLIYLDSQPGDWVGQGVQQTFTSAEGTFYAGRGIFDNTVSISFQKNANYSSWGLSFAAPKGALLVPGLYEAASLYPFQEANEPGLRVSGDSRACGKLMGRFEVVESSYGPTTCHAGLYLTDALVGLGSNSLDMSEYANPTPHHNQKDANTILFLKLI